MGLTHGVRLANPVAKGGLVRWSDVAADPAQPAVRLRREMEELYRPALLEAAE